MFTDELCQLWSLELLDRSLQFFTPYRGIIYAAHIEVYSDIPFRF